MRSNISVKYFLRKTQQKEFQYKIYGRIRHNRVKSEFATDIFILKEDWNEKFCRSYNDTFINERLSRIEANVYEIKGQLLIDGYEITSKLVRDVYLGRDKIQYGIVEFIERYIEKKSKIETLSKSYKGKFKNIKRALLFSDMLIKLLRKRGPQVTIIKNEKYSYNNGIRIVIDGEPYKFCVRETRKRTMKKGKYWDTAEYFPSGILTLRIEESHRYEWKDTANVPLENKLSHILAYLELRAQKEKKERIARKIWNEEYKRKRELEREIQQKRTNELIDFKQLITDSARWQKAINLRNYLTQIESNAKKNNSLSNDLKEWLICANHKADWYDPLIEKEEVLLSDINKETLAYKSNYNS